MKSEWLRCPRCKNKRLKAELLSTEPDGTNNMWWVCENYTKCMFPFDMPANIYKFTQTVYQKRENYYQMPQILSIPERYRYMYPLTFANSRPTSRCNSAVATKANSRNESIESSENTSTTSGHDRIKADGVRVEADVASTSGGPSTSGAANGEQYNIEADLDADGKKLATCRTIRRRRYHDSKQSWSNLVEKVASDPVASSKIINMEESELFSRMKEFFNEKYFRGTAISFKRPARLDTRSSYGDRTMAGFRRVTYRFDDVETCLRTITQDDWETARRRLPQMTVKARMAAMQSANAHQLLKSVGIDVEQRRIAVREKVGRVMKGFNASSPAPSVAKRRKIDDSDSERRSAMAKQKKDSSLRNEIHLSVSARLLNRKLRNDEERSATSTPAPPQSPFVAEPTVSADFSEPQPVHFQLGNEDDEPEQNWNFDLDGLYDDIDAQNQQPNDDFLLDGMLGSLDDNQPHQDPPADMAPVVESDEEREEVDEDDEYAGFDDFGSGGDSSNFDFVNDNFGF